MIQKEIDKVSLEISKLLKDNGKTLSVIETAAGGLISANLIQVEGASDWFQNGLILYSDKKLSSDNAPMSGWVSEMGVTSLALGAYDRGSVYSDFVFAESSIIKKREGSRSSKPDGLVYIAILNDVGELLVKKRYIDPHCPRLDAMAQICYTSLYELHKYLAGRFSHED